MIRPYTGKAAILGGAHGTKAVSLQDLDNFLDYLVDGEEGTSPQELLKVVAWIFFCLRLRSDLVSGVPFLIFPMEVEKDEAGKEIEWGLDMRRVLWQVEAWMSLHGAAYVLKQFRGRELTKLQVLNAYTVKVLAWDDDGPTSFEQRHGSRRNVYQADEIVYFRTWSTDTDIGPGLSSGKVSQKPGRLVDAINTYAGAFFDNGAIPAVLLTTAGSVPPAEKTRIQKAWEQLFQGARNAFRTAVLEQGLTPTVIGQNLKDLAMPDLEQNKRAQILATFGVPPGYVDRMNRAERALMEAALWNNSLIPEIETWIEPTLNEQLFNPLGNRISFQYRQIEALQEMELSKAESAKFLLDVMNVAYTAGVVQGKEYRSWVARIGEWSDMPPLDEAWKPEEKEDKPEPQPIPPQLVAANLARQMAESEEPPGEDEDETPKSAHPKVSAPPRWGSLRVGQSGSLRN